MLGAAIVLSAMHVTVRFVSKELHVFEVVFFRNLFGLLAISPLLFRAGWSELKSKQPRLHVVRGLTGVIAMFTWFYALTVVPVADATALSFMSVVFASIGAVLFLGEKMRIRRWGAVFTGFAGALVILRPGFESLDPGMLMALISSFVWGVSVVIVKRLSTTDSVVCIVSWMAISLTVMSFVPAVLVWQWPTATQLAWLFLIGTLGTAGHLLMTNALRIADATAVLPLDFTRLIWASVLGYLVFAEVPDIWVWLGGGIIVASATYIIYRESKTQSKPVVVST